MKYTAMLLSLSLLVSAGAFAGQALADEANKKSQTISRAGSQPSAKGSAEYFTGNVRIDPLFPANDSAHFSGAYITFEPGARSAWHIHPTGQHLLVTAGVDRTQEWGGSIVEIKPGDVIWCPPGVKHWHGASPTTAMTWSPWRHPNASHQAGSRPRSRDQDILFLQLYLQERFLEEACTPEVTS
jgi:quercetin dioxygenase-like cupin family protein